MELFGIWKWMVTGLGLGGNELLLYSQLHYYAVNKDVTDEEVTPDGAAEILGLTKQGATKNLNNLVKKKLVAKRYVMVNNVKVCKYHCLAPTAYEE